MAKKDLDFEMSALTDVPGVDPNKILKQLGEEPVPGETPPGETPSTEGTPPGETPPGTPPAASTPPGETPPTEEPPAGTPPAAGTPPGEAPPVDVNQVQAGLVKEIFGDQFKTFDDLKQADVPSQLKELQTLREEKTDLEKKLELKPKTNFANDDMALFNEFVKETKSQDFGTFRKIHSGDLTNMESMDVLVTEMILRNPKFAGQEENLKKHFEKKYNLNPEEVDESELAVNKVGMQTDAEAAREKLQEVKSKLKIPDPPEETPAQEGPKELTPEQKQTLQTNWTGAADEIMKVLGNIPITMKDSKEPVISYQLDDESQKAASKAAVSYCVQNQLELNEENVKQVAGIIQNQIIIGNMPNIVHSVFEKARSLTEEEVSKLYDNPNPARNTDTPPTPEKKKPSAEEKKDAAFNLEMKG